MIDNTQFHVDAYGMVVDGYDYVRTHFEQALRGSCPMSNTGNSCRNPTCRFNMYVGTVGYCRKKEKPVVHQCVSCGRVITNLDLKQMCDACFEKFAKREGEHIIKHDENPRFDEPKRVQARRLKASERHATIAEICKMASKAGVSYGEWMSGKRGKP